MGRVGTVPPGLARVQTLAVHVTLSFAGSEMGLCQWEVGMGSPSLELLRFRSMVGWGLAPSCASVSMAVAAGQERAACQQGASLSDLFLQAQGPRAGCCSQLEHWTPQSPAVEGRQEGKAGTAVAVGAGGTQASWPQTRNGTPPTPALIFWGQLSFGAELRMLISPGGPCRCSTTGAQS